MTFTPHSPDDCMLQPKLSEHSKNGETQVYAPPLGNFSMLATELNDGEEETIKAIGGPSVFIVTRGCGIALCGVS